MSGWIGPLRELLAKGYRESEVEQAALAALGFPAVMATSGSEIAMLRDWLFNH